jgi:hypothetical protein
MRTTVVCLGVMLAVAVQAHGCRTEGTFRNSKDFGYTITVSPADALSSARRSVGARGAFSF